MTFMQDPEPPITYKRIYQDFTGLADGTLPAQWTTRQLTGTVSPRIYSEYMRNGGTAYNTNSRSIAGYTADSVATDNQIIRGTTRTALNGLVCAICLKMDASLNNGVMAMLTTGTERGLYTITGGTATKRVSLNFTHAIGDIWALKADGNVYTLLRNPNADNTGGTTVVSWTDTTSIVAHGVNNRFGAFVVNSDQNLLAVQSWGAGLDNFDFRDLAWVA